MTRAPDWGLTPRPRGRARSTGRRCAPGASTTGSSTGGPCRRRPSPATRRRSPHAGPTTHPRRAVSLPLTQLSAGRPERRADQPPHMSAYARTRRVLPSTPGPAESAPTRGVEGATTWSDAVRSKSDRSRVWPGVGCLPPGPSSCPRKPGRFDELPLVSAALLL